MDLSRESTEDLLQRKEELQDALGKGRRRKKKKRMLKAIRNNEKELEAIEQILAGRVAQESSQTRQQIKRAMTPHASRTKEQRGSEAMERLGEEILRPISAHGEIVADLNAKEATRLCIAIKQSHGGEDMRHMFNNSAYPYWIEHQMGLYRLQRDISKTVGIRKMKFFLEGSPRDRSKRQSEFKLVRDNSMSIRTLLKPFTDTPEDTYLPAAEVSQIQRLLASGKEEEASGALQILAGASAFIQSMIVQGCNINNCVYGLRDERNIAHDEKIQRTVARYLHADNETLFRQYNLLIAEWFQLLHPDLMKLLDQQISPGNTGLLVLGGAHFRSGNANNLKEFESFQFEDYVERSPGLRNMRIMVVNTHGWHKLLQEKCKNYF